MPAPTNDRPSSKLDRRTFLKRGLLAGGAVAAGGVGVAELLQGAGGKARRYALPAAARRAAGGAPNVLVIVVDQMRSDPDRRPSGPIPPGLLPNIEALGRESVRFGNHYTASNDCTPARSTMVTGLYTHQTGCMITGGSTLDPGFPTWGTLMREQGYDTWWFGKWHLTHRDSHWTRADAGVMERYGFAGGTYPSPDGAPGQGTRVDPHIATQFEDWFDRHAGAEPWCTTVSFVNPHDIAWWYLWSDRTASERYAPGLFHALPENFQTPEQLELERKPVLQRSLQDTAAASFGPVPFDGPQTVPAWMPFLDLYAKLQRDVDHEVGRVLRTLQSNPRIAAQTVVLFTSDHGEYGAAHGLRGKGAGAYEEGVRVPLMVRDPRGKLTRSPQLLRTQLTSSVDLAPLLLSIAAGSSSWRQDARYRHLAGRQDLTRILANPAARGRPYVLHATDEIVTEFAIERYAAAAPLHVLALRARGGKYLTYSNWAANSIEPVEDGKELELYDYATRSGRLELENMAGRNLKEAPLRAALAKAQHEELRAPLPDRLRSAQRRGFDDYLDTAQRDAAVATTARRRLMERDGLTQIKPRQG